ncbi:MAG: cytochrome b/b6 domain-containing protein [Candidatus Polarisedimenticolia bacterium]|nr:cytochrome c3 family protein [bacterium]
MTQATKVLTAVFLALATVPAAKALSDDTCLSCHSTKDAFADAGERAGRLVVPPDALKGSKHEGFACTQCHADLAKDDAPIPHPARLAPVDCGACHAEVAETLRKTSVHASGMKPREGAKSPCADCHGSHQIRGKDDAAAAINPKRLADTCGACHAAKDGKDVVGEWKRSIHGRAVLVYEIAEAPTCAACHKPHEIRRIADPENPLNRRNRMKVCASCHPSESAAVLRGAHGKGWAAGNADAPVCTDCHGAHDIDRPNERASRVYAGRVAATCGRCHGDPALAARNNLKADRVSTYQNSYHGKGSLWHSSNVANCASCHQYHDVRGSSDPASPINDKNIRATCGRPDCHPNATAEFARLPVHAGADARGRGLLRSIKISYLLLIFGTLGGMALHQLLELFRLFRARRRPIEADPGDVAPPRAPPLSRLEVKGGRYVVRRWDPNMVVQHLLLTITFTTLAATGFLLELPAAAAGNLGAQAFALRANLHRIAAVLLLAVGAYHLIWLRFTARGRREFVAMLPLPLEEFRHLWRTIRWFVGIDERPPAGRRYNYREKAEYWALVWGTAVMGATGIILWTAPRWHWLVVEVARVVHLYEAMLAVGAILIWHMLGVQFRPGIHGTHPTWIDGTITPHLMKEEHAAEYRQMVLWHGVDPERDVPPSWAEELPRPAAPPAAPDGKSPEEGASGAPESGGNEPRRA